MVKSKINLIAQSVEQFIMLEEILFAILGMNVAEHERLNAPIVHMLVAEITTLQIIYVANIN